MQNYCTAAVKFNGKFRPAPFGLKTLPFALENDTLENSNAIDLSKENNAIFKLEENSGEKVGFIYHLGSTTFQSPPPTPTTPDMDGVVTSYVGTRRLVMSESYTRTRRVSPSDSSANLVSVTDGGTDNDVSRGGKTVPKIYNMFSSFKFSL